MFDLLFRCYNGFCLRLSLNSPRVVIAKQITFDFTSHLFCVNALNKRTSLNRNLEPPEQKLNLWSETKNGNFGNYVSQCKAAIWRKKVNKVILVSHFVLTSSDFARFWICCRSTILQEFWWSFLGIVEVFWIFRRLSIWRDFLYSIVKFGHQLFSGHLTDL